MITQDIGERNNLANTATAKRDELIDDLLAWWKAKLQKELDAWMIQQKDTNIAGTPEARETVQTMKRLLEQRQQEATRAAAESPPVKPRNKDRS